MSVSQLKHELGEDKDLNIVPLESRDNAFKCSSSSPFMILQIFETVKYFI